MKGLAGAVAAVVVVLYISMRGTLRDRAKHSLRWWWAYQAFSNFIPGVILGSILLTLLGFRQPPPSIAVAAMLGLGLPCSYLVRDLVSKKFPNATAFIPYKWAKLKEGMLQVEVVQLLGNPVSSVGRIWYYAIYKSRETGAVWVKFDDDGTVVEWQEPGACA